MKRGLIAGLALIVAFAIIGVTGCKEADPKPTAKTYTLSFFLNYEGASTAAWKTEKVKQDAELGATVFAKITTGAYVPVRTGYEFLGWFPSATTGSAITATFKPTANTNLYAQWADLRYTKVTFNPNGGTPPDVKVEDIDRGTVVPSAKIPTVTRAEYIFKGWFEATATTPTLVLADTAYDLTKALPTNLATLVLYAKWAYDWGDAEIVFLENGAYAMYKFTIPTSSKWGNYKAVTVDFMFDEDNFALAEAGIRGKRLLGFYKPDSKAFTEFKETDDNDLVILRQNNTTLNPYIAVNTTDSGGKFAEIDAENKWVTITFDIDPAVGASYTAPDNTKTSAHGDFNKATGQEVAGAALPEDTYNGVLFVALGITRGYATGYADTDTKRPTLEEGLSQWIRNVTLVGKDATVADISATKPAATEPQFNTYIDPRVYSYRGAPDEPVAIPPGPVVEKPVFPPPSTTKPAAGRTEITDLYYEGGNANNQRGWKTTDAGKIAVFAWAKYLEFEIDAAPNGGGVFIIVSDVEGGSWYEGKQVFAGSGGTLQNGATLIAGDPDATPATKDRIRIEIEGGAFGDYYGYLHSASTLAGLALGYWGNGDVASLVQVGIDGVNKAWLIVE
jgi:uncharacterized repeat protein (TIGR02543 family)